MTDIIRMARSIYGPQYDQMLQEAGRIKQEYVAGGGNPQDVYSPERIDIAAAGGMGQLEQEPSMQRPDGSIAGPYVPTEMAITMNMIEPRAMPAVLSALTDGVNTVSSGVDPDGTGFAIGRGPSGQIVKIKG